MGYDLYGIGNPGAHFRAGGVTWSEVWDIATLIAPRLTAEVQRPWDMDGDGLDHERSLQLHEALRLSDQDGTLEAIFYERAERVAALPDVLCRLCRGTGVRIYEGRTWTCRGCDGRGSGRPLVPTTTIEHMRQFIDFLGKCQGFKIT